MTSFVDDVAVCIASRTHLTMRSVCKQVLDKFDHAIELHKFEQNVDKG